MDTQYSSMPSDSVSHAEITENPTIPPRPDLLEKPLMNLTSYFLKATEALIVMVTISSCRKHPSRETSRKGSNDFQLRHFAHYPEQKNQKHWALEGFLGTDKQQRDSENAMCANGLIYLRLRWYRFIRKPEIQILTRTAWG